MQDRIVRGILGMLILLSVFSAIVKVESDAAILRVTANTTVGNIMFLAKRQTMESNYFYAIHVLNLLDEKQKIYIREDKRKSLFLEAHRILKSLNYYCPKYKEVKNYYEFCERTKADAGI